MEILDDVPRRIQLLQTALTLVQRDRNPQEWAGIQGNVGNLYLKSEHGNRADNIERAIEAFEALNTVYTQETNGGEWWAFAQFDLAKAYYARLQGDRASNIERAIQAWENALTVFTPERNLEEWATTQNNLATAYTHRTRGSRDKDLAWAIQLLDQLTSMHLEQRLPELWATVQENLGDAYEAGVRYGHVDSLEQAIQAWDSALSVYSPANSDEGWARIQSKIGFAYYRLASREPGDKKHAEMWKQAVNAYKTALNVFTRESDPKRWVEMQYNLAATLLQALEHSNTAPKLDVDARSISKMFLDVTDCCARSVASSRPDVEYAGLSMLGSVKALLKMPEADRKPEQIWAQLDSASKMLWQIETNTKPAPTVSRIAMVNGLTNTGALMIEQGTKDNRREIGFSWLRRALECAEKVGDQRLIASVRYQIAWQSEQFEQGDEMAVRRHLISLYEDALAAAHSDPEQFLACLKQLIHNRSVLFCRTREEQQTNIARLLELIAEGDIAVPRENPELRCGYLRERAIAYDCIQNAMAPYSGEPVIVSVPPVPDGPAPLRRPVALAEIREDIVQSLKEAIELAESLGQTYLEWELLWQQAKYLCGYGQIEAAKRALVRADSLGVEPLPLLQKPILQSLRAAVAESDGRFEEALNLYKQASDALLSAPLSWVRLGAKLYLANRAQLLISLERWEDAFQDLQQAISVEEAYLTDYQERYHALQDEYTVINLQGHLGWLSDFTQPIYADMARVCAHLHRPEDSFQYSERARASYTRRRLQVIPDCTNIMKYTGEPSGTAFLQYLIHDRESLCYVALPGRLEVFTFPGRESAEMASLSRGQVMLDHQLVSLRQLADAYAEHPEDPARLRRWCQGLDEVGRRMYDTLIAPLTSHLGVHEIVRLIVSSHSGLEQLPWNAIHHGSSDAPHYLAEDFVLYKIPSATMLQYVSAYDRADTGSIAFVRDRGSGLRYVPFEEQMVRTAINGAGGELAAQSFQDADSFYDFLAGKTRIHMACHGVFDDDNPFRTSLLLDTESRTSVQLADLLSGGHQLQPGCSIVLSACETGLVAPDQGGEYVSLSTSLMLAGARQIVAPLWAVNDLATSLLMGRFYAEWASRPTDAPGALHEAQCWLRRQSRVQLASTVQDFMHSTRIDLALRLQLIQIQKHFRTHDSEIPYAHPHWWAGFEFTGSR